MAKQILLIFSALFLTFSSVFAQECTIDIVLPTSDTTICLGDSIYLRAEGSCDVFLNNGFEGGIGVGWSSTAANPTFPSFGCDETCTWGFSNCQEYRFGRGPNGQYLWVGATNSTERTIITDTFDVTIGNCQVKFWMRFGRQENSAAGYCEDPENAGPGGYGSATGEGVHLQYSIDDGMTWVDFPGINQFPEGPNDPEPPFLTYVDGTGGYWDPTPTGFGGHTARRYDTSNVYWWHEYSCPIPPPAETAATRFRFAQLNTDQEGYDTWGLDEVKIFCSNNQNVIWGHGPTVFNPPDPVAPTDTTQYWVMVYDTVGNFATDTITIYVAQHPSTDLGPDTSICWDGTNTAYFDAGAGFEAYLWNTGDTTQFITPNTSGTYIVEVWNATCYDSDTINLTVIPATVSNAGSNESVCQGGSWDFNSSFTIPTAISADSVLWFGGAGTFIVPDMLRPVYQTDPAEIGPLTLGMIAYGSGPCGNDTSYMTLTVDTMPVPDFTTIPVDTACIGVNINFFGTANIAIANWEWQFGDGNDDNGQNSSNTYLAPGNYSISLITTSTYGCTDTVTYNREITDPLVYFSHTPDPSCENDTVFFDGQGDAVTYADWIWDFGDGSPSDTGHNVSHVYTTFGTYNVTLSVCSKDTIIEHVVIQTCDAEAGSDEIICEHYSFDFNTSATLPTAVSYDSIRWTGGLGTFDDPTVLLPVYTPAAGEVGDIVLTLVAYGIGPCGNDTSSMTLSVLDGPEADFTFNPSDSICVGELVNFSGTSTTNIVSWDWDFGDGNTASGQNVSYTFIADGTYNVQLIVVNDTACVDTVNYPVVVNILPDADFNISPNDTVCLNTPMTFDGSSTTNITDWEWDFGDGSTATGQSVAYTYLNPGDYLVSLYVLNENSCTDTVQYNVNIATLPTCDFTMSPNDTNCINEEIFFSGTGSADVISWDWDFDDGNFANGQNVSHSFASAGTYNIMLVVTNATGCTDTTIYSREVLDINIDFTITPSPSCLGEVISLDGTGDDVTFTDWIWDFGDGNSAIGRNVTHLYATFDTFNIMLIVCSDTVIHSHIVQEPASAFAGSDESICEYFSFDFSSAAVPASATAYDSLRWIGGLGTFNDPTLLLPVYTPAPGEIGPVQLSLISLARIPCSNDTSTMTLTIFDGPEADFTITPPDSICVGEWISLDASSTTTITSWDWDFGDGNTGTGQNTSHAWATAGTYDITLVVTNSDVCYDTVIYSIEVHELPAADFDILPNDSICRFEELTFNANSTTNILTWDWDLGDGNTASGQNITHSYASAGTYDVYLYVYNENSCTDTVLKQVTIFELPTSDFTMSPNDTNCINEEVFFFGTGSADVVAWDWDFGDGNTGSGQNVSHVYTSAGTYTIMLVVTNGNGCYDTTIYQREI
ncbi:MAG TPA: PKD domain-containing protein, partial [Bacteroidales bacterium]|nr:PKD domain-containing protein [Bacteroidales bacterium]